MKAAAPWIAPVAFAITLPAIFALGYWWGNARSPVTGVPTGTASNAGNTKGKVLYYRNPMGLPDTSPVPKKDAMGMDYLPVYEGEEAASTGPGVSISPERIQRLGVKTEAVALRELIRTVNAVATVEVDERRMHTVAPKFEGWIQRLHVNATGQAVKKGEALMDVYSPELVTAQHEYLVAKKGVQGLEEGGLEARAGMERLSESALQRLRNWDISETDLSVLREDGRIRQHLPLRSPVAGVVLAKSAVEGQHFMPGEMLYRIADLSIVWAMADVFEQEVALIRRGQPATVTIDAYPGEVFEGKVTFIHPVLNPETRTLRVRIELANPHGLLKPAMYGRAQLPSLSAGEKVLTVPASAVLDSGARQAVLVDLGGGRFEPREVKLGARGDNRAEVLDGLDAGEMVVVGANFLIDAESNLKAALATFSRNGNDADGAMPEEPVKEPRSPSSPSTPVPPLSPALHRGEGRVEAIDPVKESVTLAHAPIASLGWPAMVMDFRVGDRALLRALKPGQQIDFELTESAAGEYVIVRIVPSSSPGRHGRH